MKKFIVASCNANQKGGFVVKLQNKTTIDLGALGKKDKSETFYISVNKAQKIGANVDVPMDMFKVQAYPFVTPEGQTMDLNWLHLK